MTAPGKNSPFRDRSVEENLALFEGIRCYDSHKGPVVFRHREHMQRLRDSAKIYRFPVSQSID
ncbi:hypothetical protein ONJ23_28110, partial [Salmonella enterica subsp. enterica serovar Virginia]|nr:hypothetical protein [Salmonella enterica subsp. enterica serovar Virginia]